MKKILGLSLAIFAILGIMSVFTQSVFAQGALMKRNHYEMTVYQNDKVLGVIKIELYNDVAPKTVANFDSLVKAKFYDGLLFHRIIPGFVIQGGDPNTRNGDPSTWGIGDPSQTNVPAEFSNLAHKKGILSMARKGNDINSATSQFFICLGDVPHLDGQYTVFGEVTSGIEVVDKIAAVKTGARDMPADKIKMEIKKID